MANSVYYSELTGYDRITETADHVVCLISYICFVRDSIGLSNHDNDNVQLSKESLTGFYFLLDRISSELNWLVERNIQCEIDYSKVPNLRKLPVTDH